MNSLLWSIKTSQVPPLVTAGGNGVIGGPGTHVLLDNLDFAADPKSGVRYTSGYRLGSDPYSGMELSIFVLDRQQRGIRYISDGPVLGRPYINATSGLPAATLAAAPGISTGDVTIWTQAALTGFEINLVLAKRWSDTFHLSLIRGFRYLRLADKLNIDEEFLVAESMPVFGGSQANLFDEFRIANNFFGGQIGLDVGRKLGRLSFDARTKFALGLMSETANVNGSTNCASLPARRLNMKGGCSH